MAQSDALFSSAEQKGRAHLLRGFVPSDTGQYPILEQTLNSLSPWAALDKQRQVLRENRRLAADAEGEPTSILDRILRQS